MDLSYLEQLMGGAPEQTGGAAGGVWVICPDGALDDRMLRLTGKARVVADALGSYVHLLAGGAPGSEAAQQAIPAGADTVLLASGVPTLPELADFLRERAPQVVILPRTRLGRTLGPGLAHALGGGLCGFAADLAVDPVYQSVVAHQPVLDGAARQAVIIVQSPAVVVMDAGALPAAFNEPWRTGSVQEAGTSWGEPASYPPADLPGAALDLSSAPVVVAAGMGLRDRAGFELASRLAEALGGVVAGDTGALDAGWITEEQLVGLTGRSVTPRLYLALGIDGDTSQFMATAEAGCIVSVQADPNAPFVPVADYNITADPADFARAMLEALA